MPDPATNNPLEGFKPIQTLADDIPDFAKGFTPLPDQKIIPIESYRPEETAPGFDRQEWNDRIKRGFNDEAEARKWMKVGLAHMDGQKNPWEIDYDYAVERVMGQKLPPLAAAQRWKDLLESFDQPSPLDKFNGLDAAGQENAVRKYFVEKYKGKAGVSDTMFGRAVDDEAGRYDSMGQPFKDKLRKEYLAKLLYESPKHRFMAIDPKLSADGRQWAWEAIVSGEPKLYLFETLPKFDQTYMMDYVTAINPGITRGWTTEAVDRVGQAGKRSVIAIAQSAESVVRMTAAPSDPSAVYSMLSKDYDESTIDSFDRDAIRRKLKLRELIFNQNLRGTMVGGLEDPFGVAPILTAADQKEIDKRIDSYLEQIPELFRKGKRDYDLRLFQHKWRTIVGRHYNPGSWVRNGTMGALEMGVDMMAAIGVGMGGGIPASASYMAARFYGEFSTDLQLHGVDPEEANLIAMVATVPYTITEYLQINTVKNAMKPVTAKFTQSFAKNFARYMKGMLKARGKDTLVEIGEEGLQAIVENSAKAYAKEFADAEGITYDELIDDVGRQTWEAAKTMPFLMVAPAGLSAIRGGRLSYKWSRIANGSLQDVAVAEQLRSLAPVVNEARKLEVDLDVEIEQDVFNVPDEVVQNFQMAETTEDKRTILSEYGYDDRQLPSKMVQMERRIQLENTADELQYDDLEDVDRKIRNDLDKVDAEPFVDPEDVLQTEADQIPGLETPETMSADEVRNTVENMGFGPSITVVQSVADLPERLRTDAARRSYVPNTVEGVTDTGAPHGYVVVDNLVPNRADKVIVHEAVAHVGTRKAFGEERFNQLLDAMAGDTAILEKVLPIARQRGLEMADPKKRREAVEEWLGKFVEKNDLDQTTWQKIVAKVREWLRKIGFKGRWTDNDVKALLSKAKAAAMAKEKTGVSSDAATELRNDRDLEVPSPSALDERGSTGLNDNLNQKLNENQEVRYSFSPVMANYAAKVTGISEQTEKVIECIADWAAMDKLVKDAIKTNDPGFKRGNANEIEFKLKSDPELLAKVLDTQATVNERTGLDLEIVAEDGTLVMSPIQRRMKTERKPKFGGFAVTLSQIFIEQLPKEVFEEWRKDMIRAQEHAYNHSVENPDKPVIVKIDGRDFPVKTGKMLNATTKDTGKQYDEFRLPGVLKKADKTLAALNLSSACVMFMVGGGGCYFDGCYVTGMGMGGNTINFYQAGAYLGEILALSDEEVANLNSVGGLRMNGQGDTVIEHLDQWRDVMRHAEMRGLKMKVITKQAAVFEILQKLHDEGLAATVLVQPTIDPYWTPVEEDNVPGSGAAALGLARQTGDPAVQDEIIRLYKERFGRDAKVIDGKLYRKWGFTWEQIDELREKYPDVKVRPRVVVGSPMEIAEWALHHPEAIQTWMHAAIRPGLWSDVEGRVFSKKGDIGNYTSRIAVKEVDGEWRIMAQGKKGTEELVENRKAYQAVERYVKDNYSDEQADTIFKTLAGQLKDTPSALCCAAGASLDACADCTSHCHDHNAAEWTTKVTAADVGENADSENTGRYSIATPDQIPPADKQKIGYRALRLINGRLYPAMIGDRPLPFTDWLVAEYGLPHSFGKNGEKFPVKSFEDIPEDADSLWVKDADGGQLAFRPGWHLGEIPSGKQFLKRTGEWPAEMVWVEVLYGTENDYDNDPSFTDAIKKNKVRSLPANGFYKYKTNPDKTSMAWIITDKIKHNRILSDSEVKKMVDDWNSEHANEKEQAIWAPREGGTEITPADAARMTSDLESLGSNPDGVRHPKRKTVHETVPTIRVPGEGYDLIDGKVVNRADNAGRYSIRPTPVEAAAELVAYRMFLGEQFTPNKTRSFLQKYGAKLANKADEIFAQAEAITAGLSSDLKMATDNYLIRRAIRKERLTNYHRKMQREAYKTAVARGEALNRARGILAENRRMEVAAAPAITVQDLRDKHGVDLLAIFDNEITSDVIDDVLAKLDAAVRQRMIDEDVITERTKQHQKNPVFRSILQKTLANAIDTAARQLTYGRDRERILRNLEKFNALQTLPGILRNAKHLLQGFEIAKVKEDAGALRDEIFRELKTKKITNPSWKDFKGWSKAEMIAFDEAATLNFYAFAAGLSQQRAQEIIGELSSHLQPTAAQTEDTQPIPQSADGRNFLERTMDVHSKIKILERVGGLANRTAADLKDILEEVKTLKKTGLEKQRKLYDRLTRIPRENVLRIVEAIGEPARPINPAQEKGMADALKRFLSGYVALPEMLKDMIRYAPNDVVRAQAESLLDKMYRELAGAYADTEVRTNRDMEQFSEKVAKIYGISADEAYDQLSTPVDAFSRFAPDEQMPLSKANLMFIYMMALQPDLRRNMGAFNNKAHLDDLTAQLTSQDVELVNFMLKKYKEWGIDLDRYAEALYGHGLVKTGPTYSPASFDRNQPGLSASVELFNPIPGFMIPRVPHNHPIDVTKNALDVFTKHLRETAWHSVAGEISLQWYLTFRDPDFQSAFKARFGTAELATFERAVTDALNNAVPAALRATADSGFLNWARSTYTLARLSGNFGSMFRQMSSVYGFATEIGLLRTAEFLATAFTPDGIAAMGEIIRSDYAKARFGAFDAEIVDAMGNVKASKLKKIFAEMMKIPGMGDLVPTLLVGQGIYRAATVSYQENHGMTEQEAKKSAMRDLFVLANQSQQSSWTINQTEVQRRGTSASKMLLMFKSTLLQQLSKEISAVRDVAANAKNKRAWTRLGKTLLIEHVLLPGAYHLVNIVYNAILGHPPEEDDWDRLVMGMMLGPLNAFILFGSLLEAMAAILVTGKKPFSQSVVPLQDASRDAARLFQTLREAKDESLLDTGSELIDVLTDQASPLRDAKKAYKNYTE